MNIEDLTVKQVREIAGLFAPQPQPAKQPAAFEGGWCICILHRGFVLVGNYSRTGDECILKDGGYIRRWGTEHGLPQLAEHGQQPNTVVDWAVEPIRWNRVSEIMVLEAWHGQANWRR